MISDELLRRLLTGYMDILSAVLEDGADTFEVYGFSATENKRLIFEALREMGYSDLEVEAIWEGAMQL